MALKWVEGFESYSNLINFLQYRYNTFTAPSATFTAGRAIGNALLMNGTQFVTPTFTNQITWTVGFAFKNVNLSASNINMPLISFNDTTASVTTAQVTLCFNPSTRLFVALRGSTVLGTGTFAITTGAWYYVEAKITVDPTTGSFASKVNTIADISFTGNTQSSANTYANNIAIRGPAGAGVGGAYAIDDYYICDGTGGANNSFLGDMKVEPVTVNDAGTYTDWGVNILNTPNFEAVQVLNDGLYIQSNTATQKDSYTTSKLNFITGSIAGVSANYWVRNTDSTTHTIKSLVRTGGIDYLSSAMTINNTAFLEYSNIWEQDPSTAAAWTVTGVDVSQFGVELNS